MTDVERPLPVLGGVRRVSGQCWLSTVTAVAVELTVFMTEVLEYFSVESLTKNCIRGSKLVALISKISSLNATKVRGL